MSDHSDDMPLEAAKKMVALRASPEAQARLDELAERNGASRLTANERHELESYVRANTFIAILQSKARAVIKRHKRKE